jgi:hypothetical protein
VELRVLLPSLVYLGRTKEVARVGNELEAFARKTSQSFPIALSRTVNALAEFGKAPDLDKLESDLREALNPQQTAQFAFWAVISEAQLCHVDFYRGNWAGALSHAQASCRSEPGSASEGLGSGPLFRQMAYAGDRPGALAFLNEKYSWMPRAGRKNRRGEWTMLACVIEGLTMLGEQAQTADLYPLAREMLDTGAITIWTISRFTETVAGMAATAAEEWESAEGHFETAMQQAKSLPSHLEQAEIRRFHAMMLIDRSAVSDREKAQTLLNEALESYERIGMPRHVEMTQTLLARAAGR